MINDKANENEKRRLASLHALNILDSENEPTFDGLVEVAAEVCGVPISLVSLIDKDRQWFKANTGLPGTDETPRDIAFCSHAIEGNNDLLEIQDASADPRFNQNPLVTGAPDIRFYAGAKLKLADGSVAGTLCVIDRQPKVLTDTQRKLLINLANAVVDLLEARGVAEKLAASESKFRGLCDASPLGIFSSDIRGACDYTNQQCQQLLGVSEQQALGQGWQDSLHQDDRKQVLSQLQITLEQQKIFNNEFRIVHSSGNTKHVRAIAVPTFNSGGAPNGSVGIIEDTTERILETRSLAEERSRLASIIKSIGAGTWEWNVQTQELRVSQRFREISGHPDLPFSNVNDTRFQVHSDDLENSDYAMQQHLTGETNRYEFERRLKQEDDNWKWVLDCGQIVTRTAEGKPEWMFGTRLDINDFKLQAQQLVIAREQLAADQRRGAVTQERLRLARDMHDTLAHSLMALLTQIRVVRKLRNTLPEEELESELESLETVALSGIAEARAAITQMRHNDVSEIGLDGAIQSLCDRFSEHTGIESRIRIDRHDAELVRQHAETLFRITEEALHNVERHSKANQVSIRLTAKEPSQDHQGKKRFQLYIKDNGHGFDTSQHLPGHYGVLGMEEQAALIDGEFSLQSSPDGTTVSIVFEV